MLTTAFISNGIGIAMMFVLIITNREHIKRTKMTRYLSWAVYVTILSCIAEIVGFAIDGRQGTVFTVIGYINNSWLFFAVILVTSLWLLVIAAMTETKLSNPLRGAIVGINAIGIAALIVNVFHPIVFSLENNIYQRQSLYWIYVCMGALYLLYGVILCYKSKKRDEFLIRFSVVTFIAPVVLGVAIQTMFYGISVIWVGIAIAIQGMASSMKNSLIFMDSLTGVFNHLYMKDLDREYKEKIVVFTGLMADLNDFKSVNDAFGHGEGDKAIIATAKIYSKAVLGRGRVIRCAGDEFIVIIRSLDKAVVEDVISKIEQGFKEYNLKNKLDYTLSASMGQAVFDSTKQSFHDFMNVLDEKMYENKQKHYEDSQYDRRKKLPLQ